MNEASYSLVFPFGYLEDAPLSYAKDHVSATLMLSDGSSYELCFTTLVRLAQDCPEDLRKRGYYFEPNLIIVPDVEEATIRAVVSSLVLSTSLRLLGKRHDAG